MTCFSCIESTVAVLVFTLLASPAPCKGGGAVQAGPGLATWHNSHYSDWLALGLKVSLCLRKV